MSVPKKIRRFWMWVGIALLIELAAITLWKRWYWFFPSRTVSEIYTRYAGTEGFNVLFFKDFKVNDTVSVDVTYIQATADSTWLLLQNDFNVIDFPPEITLPTDTISVDFWYAPRNNYAMPMDSILLNNDIVAVYYSKKTIVVFGIEEKEQADAIISNHLSKIKN